jgi:hypothetical protein
VTRYRLLDLYSGILGNNTTVQKQVLRRIHKSCFPITQISCLAWLLKLLFIIFLNLFLGKTLLLKYKFFCVQIVGHDFKISHSRHVPNDSLSSNISYITHSWALKPIHVTVTNTTYRYTLMVSYMLLLNSRLSCLLFISRNFK